MGSGSERRSAELSEFGNKEFECFVDVGKGEEKDIGVYLVFGESFETFAHGNPSTFRVGIGNTANAHGDEVVRNVGRA